MNWNAEIVLKSGKVVTVTDLKSINWKLQSSSSVVENTEFEKFVLPSGRILSFVGEKQIVSLSSNEIEYLTLHQIS